jgi:ketosteroid isomerase-like protein
MTDSPETIARAFVQAINRHDPAALAGMMTAGHRFIDSLGNVVEGRDKMRAGWAGYFRMVPDYTISIDETFCDRSIVAMFGKAQGTYTADGELRPESSEKNRWQTPAAFRAVIEDGKLSEWRVYADNDPIRRLMTART